MIDELKDIQERLESVGRDLRREERECAAELAERQRLGLQGDAAVAHYDSWMRAHGLAYMATDAGARESAAERAASDITAKFHSLISETIWKK